MALVAGVSAAFCVSWFAAAGAANAVTSRASTLGAVRRPLPTAAFAFLLGSDTDSASDRLLFSTQQRLTQECMAAQRLRYIPESLTPPPDAAVSDATSELTITGTPPPQALVVKLRERHGYGIYDTLVTPRLSGPASIPANDRYVDHLSPEARTLYVAALQGSGSHSTTVATPGGGSYTMSAGGTPGCYQLALDKIYSSPQGYFNITYVPENLRQALLDAVARTPVVVAAVKRWSGCFHTATGQLFANPTAVAISLDQQYASSGPTPTEHAMEIRYAVADARCGYQSGLAQTYSHAFWWYADDLTGPEYSALLAAMTAEQEAIGRAHALASAQRSSARVGRT